MSRDSVSVLSATNVSVMFFNSVSVCAGRVGSFSLVFKLGVLEVFFIVSLGTGVIILAFMVSPCWAEAVSVIDASRQIQNSD